MGKGQKELIDQGYPKSSAYNAARKLKNNKIGSPAFPVSGELQELRHQSDIKNSRMTLPSSKLPKSF